MTARRRSMLVIMAKEPVPGKVKTRLQPHLTPDDSAALYRCFLLDRLEAMRRLPGMDVAVAYTPPSSTAAFTSLVPDSLRIFPQDGDNLTERLTAVVSTAFAGGCQSVAVMDSDSPDLPRERVLQSFSLLAEGADVVFGPCGDGGYYLVALKKERRGIFEGIPWSTSTVLEESLARAAALGLKTALLEPWQDIDTFEDLLDFVRRSGADRDVGTGPCVRTLAFLEERKALLLRDGS